MVSEQRGFLVLVLDGFFFSVAETVLFDETIQLPNCMHEGLTTVQAHELLARFGPNEIAFTHESWFHRIAKAARSPITLMLLFAAALSFVAQKEWDGYFVLFFISRKKKRFRKKPFPLFGAPGKNRVSEMPRAGFEPAFMA